MGCIHYPTFDTRIDAIGDLGADFVAPLSGQFERHFRIDAEGEQLLSSSEPVLEAPPAGALWFIGTNRPFQSTFLYGFSRGLSARSAESVNPRVRRFVSETDVFLPRGRFQQHFLFFDARLCRHSVTPHSHDLPWAKTPISESCQRTTAEVAVPESQQIRRFSVR